MGLAKQQQETVNTCINNCLQTFNGIQKELCQARAQNAELRKQVGVTKVFMYLYLHLSVYILSP